MKGKLQLNIKTYLKSLMLMGVVLAFAACQEKDEFTPDPISGNVNDFYEDAQGIFGGETFDVSADYIYITSNNTSVHVPANSLVYPDGSDVEGMVSVVLEDVLNKGELIVHDVPTMSGEKLLSSEGAIFVSFIQDGKELSIKPGSLVTLRLTDPSAEANVQLYDGFELGMDNDWNISSQTISLESWSFFWDGKDWMDSGYEMYITQTGWYMVAQELSPVSSFQDQLCAELPVELFDGSNSDVFLILNDYDTVVPMEMDSEKMLFCAAFINIPEGAEAIIVSISSVGELNYYFGMRDAIISVGADDAIVFPEPQSKEQILDLLGMF